MPILLLLLRCEVYRQREGEMAEDLRSIGQIDKDEEERKKDVKQRRKQEV